MIPICRSYDLLYYTQFIDYAHELIFFKTTKMCYANNAFTEKYEPLKIINVLNWIQVRIMTNRKICMSCYA